MSRHSPQNQNSDLPQLEDGDSGKQNPEKLPYGHGLEGQVEASSMALWNMLNDWDRLLPEKVRTTPMSQIMHEVRRILPQGLTVQQYASRLMEQLWRSGRLPVQLILFRRYPRSRDVDYQVIYALMVHFGEDRLPDVSQGVPADLGRGSTSLKLGRKPLPADFLEVFTKIYNLNAEQRELIRQWAQTWPWGQGGCPVLEYLKSVLQVLHERFATATSSWDDFLPIVHLEPLDLSRSEFVSPDPDDFFF